ncbi:membrane protein [Actinobacillus porcinus]|uniref:Membrane protein n=1 Tax=Actinobacillus porcinus TaxID=51048 RepID=A0ABY6TL44_9PAST|nr:YtjB family periplasmic protein [Actinobacillus porcinus]VFY93181.1 membrane protein [Actinobacillus porcinus]VTU07904.1 membrane protein [Actinobacillus porcinus]
MQILHEKIKKSALFATIIVLCLAALGVILFGVKQFHIGSQLASVNQVANLSHLLVRQQTNLLAMLLLNNAKTEKLTETLDNLAQESFVIDASLYNGNGELIAQSHGSQSLRAQLGLEDNTTARHQQIVEPIYSKNGVEGFLRITFNSQYGQTTQSKTGQLFKQLYGEFIVIFLVGIVLASSVHYFLSHYRRAHRTQDTPTKITRKRLSNNALSYHRRRRRT